MVSDSLRAFQHLERGTIGAAAWAFAVLFVLVLFLVTVLPAAATIDLIVMTGLLDVDAIWEPVRRVLDGSPQRPRRGERGYSRPFPASETSPAT